MSGNRKSRTKQTRLTLESLEARSLLSGIHAVASTHVADHHPAIVSTSSAKAATAAAKSVSQHSETHLVATLKAVDPQSSLTGTAKFESESTNGVVKSELCVQVKGAAVDSVIDVAIVNTTTGKSSPAGQIKVKADGTGQLTLKANAPAVDANSTIALSTTTTDAAGVSTTTQLASAAFVTPASKPEGAHGSEQNETHLTAALADTASTLTGTASYESETEHGLVVSEFSVRIKGAVPDTLIDVSVDGTSVGQFTVGKDGTGRLTLKSNVPAVSAGSKLILSTVNADKSLTLIASTTFSVPTSTKRK